MNQEDILSMVTAFAAQAHGRQLRKYSAERYIVHPVEVMKICSHYTDETPVLCAALLHDVLEDTPTAEEEIRDFLNLLMEKSDVEKTIKWTVELTDVYTTEVYPNLNRKTRKEKEHHRLAHISPEAQTIKYADLISNSVNIIQHDKEFGYVFLQEAGALLKLMNQGDDALYTLAVETIKDCLFKANRQLTF